MAEVPTHFPPQTYSSSFFLNAIPEDDKVGNKIKVKNKDETTTQSSPILDCFMKTMICIFLLGVLPLTMAYPHQCTSLDPSEAKVRVFSTIKEYHSNKIVFDPTELDFKGNSVRIKKLPSTLDKNVFVTYDSNYIISLILNNAGITNILSGSFLELFCLTSLELQNNKISTIEEGALQDLGHLRYLNLSSNSIESLHVNAFDNMTHLISLDLSFNKMQTFDCTLRNVTWLINLNLTHNYLTTLDFRNWQLPNLKVVDASYNNLNHLETWTEHVLSDLAQLYLGHNLLKKLNIFAIRKMAPELGEISLEFNPWECAVLDSMIRALADSHIVYASTNSTPDHIDGVDCIPGNDRNVTPPTTQPPHVIPPSVPGGPVLNITQLLQSNAEVLDEVSDLKTIVVFLFIFFIVFAIFEIVVRSGAFELVVRRFRRADDVVLFDNNVPSVENIRLLPCSSNAP